jgi:uncharacterized membrane protein
VHVYFGPDAVEDAATVRRISVGDAFLALKEGFDDFRAMPSHLFFLAIFYAAAGIVLTYISSFGGALQLAFPLAAGFALVGPFLAVGLYELSRRRELGLEVSVFDSFIVANSPALPSIACLGLALLGIFAAWIATAQALYVGLYGPDAPASAVRFLQDVISTDRGWLLIGLGGGIGILFAAFVLFISVISFPLLLDRDVGLVPAVQASVKLSRESPLAVFAWGAIVAGLMILGSLPLFIGLAVVMPVLGHGSWRFYRRAIKRDPAHEHPSVWPKVARKPAKYYSTPHSVIFPIPQKPEEVAADRG